MIPRLNPIERKKKDHRLLQVAPLKSMQAMSIYLILSNVVHESSLRTCSSKLFARTLVGPTYGAMSIHGKMGIERSRCDLPVCKIPMPLVHPSPLICGLISVESVTAIQIDHRRS